MAKKTKVLPKKVAGMKIPKQLRRSRLIGSLLHSRLGRQIVADALVAGAAAAGAVLVREREEIAAAGKSEMRKGRRVAALIGEAVESAADAVLGVVTDAARSALPEEPRPRKGRKGGSAETRH
jgi:hypothetical protein